MNINRQFQDQHSPGEGGVDWQAVQCVERDICLLYHQLANYSYIMDDLYYGEVFGIPYWEFLDYSALEPERRDFIRVGCLVMLYAMASEVLDGSGAYLTMDRNRYSAAKAAVKALPQYGNDTDRLADLVSKSFDIIDANREIWDDTPGVAEVVGASTWIHERFVRTYFNDVSEQFRSNPYFRGESPA